MKNSVFIAVSLDGYIADSMGGIDWLNDIPNPDNSDFGFSEFFSTVDALVMGRNTFEKVLSFPEWPYEKPVFVMSSSMQTVPAHLAQKAFLLNQSPAEATAFLYSKGFRSLYTDGGKLITSFLEHRLITDLILTRVPVLLGSGIPLFGRLSEMIRLSHIKTEVLNNYLVQSRYGVMK